MAAQVGAIQHTFKMTKDRIDIETARAALMVLSGTSVVARIVGGIAALKISLTKLTAFLMAVQSVGIAILAIGDSTFEILAGAVILGTAMGNLLMFHPLLLAEAFGVKDYARIYGMGSLLMIFGVGSGPFLVGLIRDISSYRSAFAVLTIFAIAGLAFLAAAGKPPSFQPSAVEHEAKRSGQRHGRPVLETGQTLTPAHQIEQPSIPPRRRVAVIDRGAAMGEARLGVSKSATGTIPQKGSDQAN
jgi:MFS family permease